MNCPACNKNMVEKDFVGAKVDICESGCKGIWFDWFELERLDEKSEGIGQALAQALASDRHKDDHRGQIKCPKCKQPMVAHLYKSCKMITIDECYGCGGFYLDSGELEVIRGNFLDAQGREEYVHQLLSARTDYFTALEELKRSEEAVNPGSLHRAAVTKLVNIIGNKFQK